MLRNFRKSPAKYFKNTRLYSFDTFIFSFTFIFSNVCIVFSRYILLECSDLSNTLEIFYKQNP